MTVTATTSGTQTLLDSTANTTSLTKQLSASFVGSASTIAQQVNIGTGATPIALPVAQTNYVYIKNLSGAATVTVTWTPQGGASNPVITLQPGGYIEFVEPVTGSGISALSLIASAPATPVEYWLLG